MIYPERQSKVNEIIIRLGSVIKEARKHAELTQSELAENLCISRRHLLGIEQGMNDPSFSLFCAIVLELGLNMETIFHPEMVLIRSEFEEIFSLLDKCTELELITICAALDTVSKHKKGLLLLSGIFNERMCIDLE